VHADTDSSEMGKHVSFTIQDKIHAFPIFGRDDNVLFIFFILGRGGLG
jgi:hypothetical protein